MNFEDAEEKLDREIRRVYQDEKLKKLKAEMKNISITKATDRLIAKLPGLLEDEQKPELKKQFRFVFSTGAYIGSTFQLVLPGCITIKRYVYDPHEHYHFGIMVEFLCWYIEIGWEK